MPKWLEYNRIDTPVHNMQPLVKISLIASCLLLTGLWWDLRYLAILIVIGLTLVLLAKVPLYWFKILGVILLAYLPVTIIGILGQTNPLLFKVYPQSLVRITFAIVHLGVLGSYGVSVGGLLWGAASELKICMILLFTYTFIYSTDFNDIIGLLGNTRFPRQLLFVIMIAYRFVPETIRQIQVIMTALRLRGWELRSRNPKVIVERTVPLISSLLRQSLVTIDEVTLATRIRVFSNQKITAFNYVKPSRLDKGMAFLIIALLALAIAGLVLFNAGNI
jgi:energy-coupling factor transporter transmembrane protein EcfT